MPYNFSAGTYRVKVSRLNVRGTPDSRQEGNLVGIALTQGKEFPVYAIEFDKKGFPWGIITPNGAPQAHYVCLWNGNTLFAELITPPEDAPASLLSWAIAIDAWAREKGYTGQRP